MIGHWINGQTLVPEGSRSQPVYNPATGQVTEQVVLADNAIVDQAIAAAAGVR